MVVSDIDDQELEKLISYSATPTAVWRRTGELVYANPEFCGLIGKQQDDLLSGRTYVYQLFAKQAYVDPHIWFLESTRLTS